MRINILHNILLICCVLLLTACRNNDFPHSEEGTSLHLIIKNTENTIRTRGVEDLNDDGNISDNELYVDGQKMYRLIVFIVDGNNVVSSTILEADDERFSNNNSEATVSFINLDYSKRYKLYAVANYGNYEGIEGNLSDISEEEIIAGHTVTASGNNVCPNNTPYPLTLQKDINLTPGTNYVSGELTRTYARLRINVRNQSSMNDLYITNLSFPQKFTQKSADLFTEGGTASVAPVVTSGDAVTPFVPNIMIPKLNDTGSANEKTIFDTYMLESNGGTYNYTLALKYEGGTEEVYNVSNTAINNANNIEDGAMYVIYNTNSGRYLYANGSSVGTSTSYQTNGELNHNYVWRFNRSSSTNRYTIESMGATGYFMQSSQVSTSKAIPLTVTPGSSDYFTASTSSNYIRLQSTKSNYYLSVNNNTATGNSSTSTNGLRRNNFYLYKVNKEYVTADITHQETIPIRIVDKTTGEASQITSIRRNDFIEILVNVTYNEKTGNVEFEVSDWDEVNGEVTFD